MLISFIRPSWGREPTVACHRKKTPLFSIYFQIKGKGDSVIDRHFEGKHWNICKRSNFLDFFAMWIIDKNKNMNMTLYNYFDYRFLANYNWLLLLLAVLIIYTLKMSTFFGVQKLFVRWPILTLLFTFCIWHYRCSFLYCVFNNLYFYLAWAYGTAANKAKANNNFVYIFLWKKSTFFE